MAEFRRERHEDDRLSAFLDDELPDDDALVVTRHLASCDRCLGELEEIRSARDLLRGLPNLEPPAGMLSAVSGAAIADAWQLGRGTRTAVLALLCSAVVGAAVFAAGAEEDGTVSPPIDVYVVDHVTRVEGPILTPVDLGR